ncbi:hypothetical protein TNCV_4606901 [Trichonephila clavipes]|nr:hypothetical protein TNCV_4606901 [Trichonephila clavipes]
MALLPPAVQVMNEEDVMSFHPNDTIRFTFLYMLTVFPLTVANIHREDKQCITMDGYWRRWGYSGFLLEMRPRDTV